MRVGPFFIGLRPPVAPPAPREHFIPSRRNKTAEEYGVKKREIHAKLAAENARNVPGRVG